MECRNLSICMRGSTQPTPVELQALTVLWRLGPSAVPEIREALPDGRERAYTTVLTVMQNLERKGLVRHSAQGRAHVFEAACDRDAMVRELTSDYVHLVFGGRLDLAVLAILSAGDLTPEEKTNIEQQLKHQRTMPAKKATKKAAPAKKAAPVKKTAAPVKKAAPPTPKAAPKKATPAKVVAPVKKVASAPVKKLQVREDESPWTPAELRSVRSALNEEIVRLEEELVAAEEGLAGLIRDSGDGAGDDQADAGSKTFEREHEMSLANNAREMLLQVQHALARLDAGTYGICESCGKPIGKYRLQAFPRATLCLACKQVEERLH